VTKTSGVFEDRSHVRALVRWSPSEQEVEDRAEAVDVGAFVERVDVAARLFRRHVARRPHHGALRRRVAGGQRRGASQPLVEHGIGVAVDSARADSDVARGRAS
jgi:hypothetical protein